MYNIHTYIHIYRYIYIYIYIYINIISRYKYKYYYCFKKDSTIFLTNLKYHQERKKLFFLVPFIYITYQKTHYITSYTFFLAFKIVESLQYPNYHKEKKTFENRRNETNL